MPHARQGHSVLGASPRPDRVVLLVLDSVGVGGAPDAARYGDKEADTLGNVARHLGGLKLPNLRRLGLGNVTDIEGVAPLPATEGAFGKATQISAGKDTTSGHWELAGIKTTKALATFPDGFPPEIIERFREATGCGVIGNRTASGSEILDELGEEHLESGDLIVYTSADSVFQVAAHEGVVPVEALYEHCQAARAILDRHRVGRVIARPFVGPGKGRFRRTHRRRDFSLPPPRPTLLDRIFAAGLPVLGVGKIWDVFAGRGVSEKVPTDNNTDGMVKTMEALARVDRGLIMTNLIDFDSLYGHRRDPEGYARCLAEFDQQLPALLARMRSERDLLIITADHGNDPTQPGSDHTREQVPVLVRGTRRAPGVDLGVRATFADVGATIADALGVSPPDLGESFLDAIT